MKLAQPTSEQLRAELLDTVRDLCGDIYMLDCLLFPGGEEGRPDVTQAVRAALASRLADYIDQHARDAAAAAAGLAACEISACAAEKNALQ